MGLILHVFSGSRGKVGESCWEGVNTGFCIVMHGGVGRGSVRSTGGMVASGSLAVGAVRWAVHY